MSHDIKPLLNAKDVSRILAIPLQRVYELIRTGDLPAVRVGRTVRVDQDRLVTWIAAGGLSPK